MKLNLTENFPAVQVIELAGLTKFICPFEQFEDICFSLKSNVAYIWLVDIVVIDRSYSDKIFEIRYLFNLIEDHTLFQLVVELPYKNEMKSIAHLWKSARFGEKEAAELFGVKFNRAYMPMYFDSENTIYPLLKDELRSPHAKKDIWSEKTEMTLMSMAGVNNRIYFSEEKSLVAKCEIDSGYYHVGLEKSLEQCDLVSFYSHLEDYFSVKGMQWSFLTSYTAERSRGIEVPARAQALRMICLEFARIIEHLLNLKDLFCLMKNDLYIRQGQVWVKRIQALLLSACGNEYFAGTIRLGGVLFDVSQEWSSRVISEIKNIENELSQFYFYRYQSRSWKEELALSLLAKDEAAELSLSGPVARASGLNLDYRKQNPFYFYKDVEFEVPVGTSGTIYDLFMIKIEEIFQSFNILKQVLDNIPAGDKMNSDILVLSKSHSDKDEAKLKASVLNLFQVEDIDSFELIEGSNGAMGLSYILKNQKIERAKFFSNDQYLKYLFEATAKGRDPETLPLLWKALAIDMRSIER